MNHFISINFYEYRIYHYINYLYYCIMRVHSPHYHDDDVGMNRMYVSLLISPSLSLHLSPLHVLSSTNTSGWCHSKASTTNVSTNVPLCDPLISSTCTSSLSRKGSKVNQKVYCLSCWEENCVINVLVEASCSSRSRSSVVHVHVHVHDHVQRVVHVSVQGVVHCEPNSFREQQNRSDDCGRL